MIWKSLKVGKIPAFLPHLPCDSEMFPSGDLHHFVGHCAADQGPDVSVPSPVEAARVFNVIKVMAKCEANTCGLRGRGRGRGSPLKVGEVGEGGSFRPLVFQIVFFHFPVFLHVWTSGEALAGFG